MKKILEKIFKELNGRVIDENRERGESGAPSISKCEITILGQMSLLANEKISAFLTLTQTGDMDALLTHNTFVKTELKKILVKNGLVYDEDSEKIWIPKGSKFEDLFQFSSISVKVIEAESALVSKAIKAPQKNKQLIREAIASGKFKNLVNRILEHKGNLEFFAED